MTPLLVAAAANKFHLNSFFTGGDISSPGSTLNVLQGHRGWRHVRLPIVL